jgi:hypothetical protein
MMEYRFSPAILARNIAEIIRFTPDKWDQGIWISNIGNNSDYSIVSMSFMHMPENSCGTTACVAGHTVIMAAPPYYRYDKLMDTVISPDGKEVFVSTYAREALNLNDGQESWLFSAVRTKEQVLWALDKIANYEDWSPYEYDDYSYEDEDDDECGNFD